MKISKLSNNANKQRTIQQKKILKNVMEVARILWVTDMFFTAKHSIWQQLLELNANTSFVTDEARSLEVAEKVFARFPDSFSDEDKVIVRQSTVLSDIGKNGIPTWTSEQRALVRNMYAVENIPNGHLFNAEDFIIGPYAEYYGLTKEEAKQEVLFFESFATYWFPEAVVKTEQGELPLARDVSMLRFWSYGHVMWSSFELPTPQEVVAGVCLHHVLEGINAYNILTKDGKITGGYGEFTLAHALIGVIDKYDAFHERYGMKHSEIISILKSMTDKSVDNGGLSKLFTPKIAKMVSDKYKDTISLLDKAIE